MWSSTCHPGPLAQRRSSEHEHGLHDIAEYEPEPPTAAKIISKLTEHQARNDEQAQADAYI